MASNFDLEELTDEVMSSSKYAQLTGTLVSRVVMEEAQKFQNRREVIQSARTRLHRLTGAYLAPKIDYTQWLNKYKCLPLEDRSALKSTSLSMMRLHASTAERLPILPGFYQTTLASISPVNSVLDLACGLNPLSIPWMPLAEDFTYLAGDVVLPLISFFSQLFTLQSIRGSALMLDISSTIPTQPVQLALLMKTLPLMEQIERGLARKVLNTLNAEHILVTYPLRSLGGRSKGMAETYQSKFDDLMAGSPWKVQEFVFPNEVAYLITK